MTRASKTITINDLTDGERKLLALCTHESAHAVMAVALGARLRTAKVFGNRITPDRTDTVTPSGFTLIDGMPPGREPEIAFAGVWGQSYWLAEFRRPSQREVYSVLDTTGCHDKAMLVGDGMSVAAGIVPMVERLWDPITTIAGRLHREGTASHTDVLAALGITDGGGPGSYQLALLAAGYAPGQYRVTPAVA